MKKLLISLLLIMPIGVFAKLIKIQQQPSGMLKMKQMLNQNVLQQQTKMVAIVYLMPPLVTI